MLDKVVESGLLQLWNVEHTVPLFCTIRSITWRFLQPIKFNAFYCKNMKNSHTPYCTLCFYVGSCRRYYKLSINWLGDSWLQAHAPTVYLFCQKTSNGNISSMFVWNANPEKLGFCFCWKPSNFCDLTCSSMHISNAQIRAWFQKSRQRNQSSNPCTCPQTNSMAAYLTRLRTWAAWSSCTCSQTTSLVAYLSLSEAWFTLKSWTWLQTNSMEPYLY